MIIRLPMLSLFGGNALPGYSSGSAGGSVLGGAPEACEGPMPKPSDQVPVPPDLAPSPSLPPPLTETPVPELASLEAEMKSRMERHAKALEKALTDDFLEKKRQAEMDLDMEMDLKRQKRMRELEEELKEQADMKKAALESLDMQLAERMQLVADEQNTLDDLRDKSIDMRRMLEEESKKVEGTHMEHAEPPATPAASESKTAMKEKLRQKLQDTAQKKAELASIALTPSVGIAAPTPESTQVPTGPKDGAIMPITDMRFSSSTHPAAWQFLYRLTRKPDQCDQSIYEAWHAGGDLNIWFQYIPIIFCWMSMGKNARIILVFMGPLNRTGGSKRDVLLRDFVCRCYTPSDDFAKNKVRAH